MLLGPVNSHNWEGLGATACPSCPKSPQAAQQAPRQALGARAGPCPCPSQGEGWKLPPESQPSRSVGAALPLAPQPPVQWLLLLMESPGCSA